MDHAGWYGGEEATVGPLAQAAAVRVGCASPFGDGVLENLLPHRNDREAVIRKGTK